MNKLLEKIDSDKEILSTMPQNNKKNISKYVGKVKELIEEYEKSKNDIYDELNIRYKKIINKKENENIILEKTEIKEIQQLLEIIDTIKTSYEKMGLDKIIYRLGKFYKENLESINIEILNALNKFKEVGIELKAENFNYSIYVNEYMKTFFKQIKDINSPKIKEKFDKIYWKCPDLIIHVELNFRYVYEKNKKKIDKYYEARKKELLRNINIDLGQIEERYNSLKIKYKQDISLDPNLIIKKFLNNELNVTDFEKKSVKEEYKKIIVPEYIKDENMEEINQNAIKFLNNLYEYKYYLKFKYIFEDIKRKYEEKEKYKDSYNETKKEILSKEKILKKLSKKINGKNIFAKKKNKEEIVIEYNKIVLEIKDLYKKLDKDEIYVKIIENIFDSSTIYDALNFASQFYNYLCEIIIEKNKEITPEEIDNEIKELKNFLNNPYNVIIKNITILEEKNIEIIISDKYRLLNFSITKEDINEENIDILIESLEKLTNYYYIIKSGIDIEDIKFICKFKKL